MDKLAQALNSNQLEYQPIDFCEFEQVAPMPPPKLKLPNYLRQPLGGDRANYELIPSTGRYSLLNALLKTFYPGYEQLAWREQHDLVQRLLAELPVHLAASRQRDRLVSQLNEEQTLAGLASPGLVSTEAKAYLAYLFNLNLFVLDQQGVELFFRGTRVQPKRATLVLWETDDGLYYIVSKLVSRVYGDLVMTEYELLHSSADNSNQLLSILYRQTSPEHKYFKPVVAAAQKTELDEVASVRVALSKLKVDQLRALCTERDILTVRKNEKGRLVNIRKADLIDLLAEKGLA